MISLYVLPWSLYLRFTLVKKSLNSDSVVSAEDTSPGIDAALAHGSRNMPNLHLNNYHELVAKIPDFWSTVASHCYIYNTPTWWPRFVTKKHQDRPQPFEVFRGVESFSACGRPIHSRLRPWGHLTSFAGESTPDLSGLGFNGKLHDTHGSVHAVFC